MAATTKRKADDEVVPASKKAKTNPVDPVIADEDDEEPEVDADELEALDQENIIDGGGRRTRGVRVDYSKVEGADEDDEEEEEEEDEEEDEEGDDQGAEDAAELPNGDDDEEQEEGDAEADGVEDEEEEVEAEEDAEDEVAKPAAGEEEEDEE